MKKPVIVIVIVTVFTASCGRKAEDTPLRTEQDTLSWAMGMSLAQTTQSGIYRFDEKLVLEAFASAMEGNPQPLDTDTYQAACQYIAFLAQKKQRDDLQQAATQSTKNENEIFTQLLRQNLDIKKAPEGYYYQVIQQGTGPNAKPGQRIRFDFVSTNLTNGQTYVSSLDRQGTLPNLPGIIHVLGKPMIPGMIAGLQRMNAGSHYIFYFPSAQAFGAQGSDGLPPFTPLKYDIQLHEVYTD